MQRKGFFLFIKDIQFDKTTILVNNAFIYINVSKHLPNPILSFTHDIFLIECMTKTSSSLEAAL